MGGAAAMRAFLRSTGVPALAMMVAVGLLACGDSQDADVDGDVGAETMENAIVPDTGLDIPDSAFVPSSDGRAAGDPDGGADGAAANGTGAGGTAQEGATGAGAGGGGQDQPAVNGGAEEVLTGRVVSTGTVQAPMTVLQLEKGGPVGLIGDMEPELQRLAGATVRVTGTPSDRFPGGGLEVRSYEVLSIDGTEPHVGVLIERDGAFWLADSDTLRLEAVPAELQGRTGAKIWVIGRRGGDAIQIQSYGVIRD